ncbi:MAG: AAA-like domain-containing protein, partial [Pseudomonadota bacterium]|nr:AAA-like domain-containing protein [Pseudomonadota bacterium]
IPLGTRWSDHIGDNIAASDFLIVLLSANSIASEMVMAEVSQARDRYRATDAPRFIPVRVRYGGDLGYALAGYLGGWQHAVWNADADSAGLLKKILDVAEGRAALPAISEKISDTAVDFRRPEPAVDLRSITQPGGSLRPDDPFYIDRQADARVLELARHADETLVIRAPRQMGKSSLLKRYLLACQKAGKRTALIDMSLFSRQDFADYSGFLTSLAIDLLERLDLDAPPPAIRSQPDMTYFLRRTVLKAVQNPVVLAFDEVDRVLGQPYKSDFFSMLRWCHERRTDPPPNPWERVELALVISTEPYLLIADADRSPFNVRAPIELQPFSRAECQELNRRYGDFLTSGQVDELHGLLNGHPFLTRLAYYRLIGPGAMDFPTLLQAAAGPHGPFGDHLRALLAKLRQCGDVDLIAAMRRICQGGAVIDDAIFARLHGAGLVRREGGGAAPANRLYARFFGGAL